MGLNIRKLFVCYSLIIAFALTASINVKGQCQQINYDKSIFNGVIEKYREKLIQRFEMLLRNTCEKNFEAIYDMMTSSFREMNKKEDVVNSLKAYYSGNTLVSFEAYDVFGLSENEESVWFILGCITERHKGKKRSVGTSLVAIREGEEIYFAADVRIVIIPEELGGNLKCRKKKKN